MAKGYASYKGSYIAKGYAPLPGSYIAKMYALSYKAFWLEVEKKKSAGVAHSVGYLPVGRAGDTISHRPASVFSVMNCTHPPFWRILFEAVLSDHCLRMLLKTIV